MTIGAASAKNPDEVGAASVDYLMYSGYIVVGFLWVKIAKPAQKRIDAGDSNPMYASNIHTARFYFDRIMPRTEAHFQPIRTGSTNLIDLKEEHFIV